MIQGTINQLIGFAAAAKRMGDIAEAKERTAEQAKARAMDRARKNIQMRFDQNAEYKKFVQSLGNNQAPEELKRIAFEAQKNTPKVKLGGQDIDITRLSPEAQAAIRGIK